MKKLLIMLFSVLFVFSCAVVVSAEEAQYSNAGELYEAWAENLPDYICGVWSTDGGYSNLTFGIQDNEAGNAGKQKMLDLIENDSSITFVYQEYSRNYLLQIQREIDEYMKLDLGLVSTGLYDTRNCIELGILEDRKNDADTQKMIKEITDKYGNAVSVTYTDARFELTLGEEKDPMAQYSLFLPVFLVAVAVLGMLFIVIQKRGVLLQTGNGTTMVSTTAPTGKEVEEMVMKSSYKTSSKLDKKIMNAINKNDNSY